MTLGLRRFKFSLQRWPQSAVDIQAYGPYLCDHRSRRLAGVEGWIPRRTDRTEIFATGTFSSVVEVITWTSSLVSGS